MKKLLILLLTVSLMMVTFIGFTISANAESPADEELVKTSVVGDSKAIYAVGGWTSKNGSLYTSVGAGKYLLYNFYGCGIDIQVEYGSDKGSYDFYIDNLTNALEGTYSANGASGVNTILSLRNLKEEFHTIKIVPTGGSFATIKSIDTYTSQKVSVLYPGTDSAVNTNGWSISGNKVWGGVGGGKTLYVPFVGSGITMIVSAATDKCDYKLSVDGQEISNPMDEDGVYTSKLTYTFPDYTVLGTKELDEGNHILKVEALNGSYTEICSFNVYSQVEYTKVTEPISNAKPEGKWSFEQAPGYAVLALNSSETAYLEYTFRGCGISVYASVGGDKGAFDFYIDGQKVTDFGIENLYSAYSGSGTRKIFTFVTDVQKKYVLKIVPTGGSYAQVGNVEIYRNAELVSYEVSYFDGETKLTMSEEFSLVYAGESITELPTFAKEGYVFNGWKNASDEKVTSITGASADVTLYADLSKIHTVSYYDGETQLTMDEKYVKVVNGESITELPTFAKEGYVFNGWKNASDEKVTSITGASADVVLYADMTEIIDDIGQPEEPEKPDASNSGCSSNYVSNTVISTMVILLACIIICKKREEKR